MRRVLQCVGDQGQHRPNLRRYTPHSIAHLQMAAMNDARASGPELFVWIVQIEYNHIGDLRSLDARHTNDLSCRQSECPAGPCRHHEALRKVPRLSVCGFSIARAGERCVPREAFDARHRRRRIVLHWSPFPSMAAILALPLGKFASGATAEMDLKYCDG